MIKIVKNFTVSNIFSTFVESLKLLKMKVLTLSIKQKWFDEILTGKKKSEFREVRPNNFAKYARFVHLGKEYENDLDVPEDNNEITVKAVKYDALKLVTGAYKDKRPYLIVEVTGADIFFNVDDDGNDIVLKTENGDEYISTQIEYHLGKIIEKELYE